MRRVASALAVATAAIVAAAMPSPLAGARAAATSRTIAHTAASGRSPVGLGTALPPQAGGVSLSSRAEITCYSYDVPDGTGDTTGGLDGVDYRLSYDCVHKTWTATVTTAQAFSVPQLGDFEVDFDTDDNLSDGCNGIDWAVVATWDPNINALVTGAIHFAGSCNDARFHGTLPMTRTSAHDASLTWPDWFGSQAPQAFRSVAFVTGKQNPSNSDFDAMPNRGYLLSQRSASTAFSPHNGPAAGGSYTQVVGGDFNGDHRADLLFYGVGGHPDYLWLADGSGGYASKSLSIWGNYTLIPGDFNGDGVTDLLLYAPGSAPDAVWLGSPSGTFTSQPITINGNYTIVSADFNGDHRADLFFYAPGTAPDYIWYGQSDGTFQSTLAPALNNTYRIAAGDFNGDGYGDVLLLAPGDAPDHVLQGTGSGQFTVTNFDIPGDYSMLRAGDFNGDTLDDVLLLNPGTGADAILDGSTNSPDLIPGPPIVTNENYEAAVVGDFNGDGNDDVFLQAAAPIPNAMWLGLRDAPTQLEAKYFGAIAVDPTSGLVYVTSGIHGTTMTVLDRHAKFVETIRGLGGPTGVAFGPSTIYVAMTSGNTIEEFDRTTLAPIGSIDVAGRVNPLSVAYQHGKVWFTYYHGLAVWDPGTHTVSTVSTDIEKQPLLATGTANSDMLIAYSSSGNTAIERFDLSTGSAVLEKAVWFPACTSLTVSPDLSKFWYTCGNPAGMLEAATSTLTPDTTGYVLPMWSNSVTASGMNGGWVIGGALNVHGHDVYLDQIGSPTTARSFELYSYLYPRGLAMSPDGEYVYAVSYIGAPGLGPALVSAMTVP